MALARGRVALDAVTRLSARGAFAFARDFDRDFVCRFIFRAIV
jgi:hypothetical protein